MDTTSLLEYGPYAFGLIATLAIWKVVVTPSLSVLKTIVDALGDVSRTLESVQETTKVLVNDMRELKEAAKEWRTKI